MTGSAVRTFLNKDMNVCRTMLGCAFVMLLLGADQGRVGAADPVFDPATVVDSYGNKALANSSVTWAPLPAGQPYKAADNQYKDGGLGPLFNAARGFVNVVQPKDFPVDIILGVVKGSLQISSNYMELVMYGLGFAICFVIGILFFLLMPLIGCCFCCCRCCGNCGGKMLQRYEDNANCKRITFSICLFICSVFLTCGATCTYLSSDRMTVAIDEIGQTLGENMDDLVAFMGNTYDEMEFVALQDFVFASKVITRDLDNIGYLVGIPVRDELATNGGVDGAVNAIESLETEVNSAGTALLAVSASIATIKQAGTTLQNDLNSVKTKINDAKVMGGCAATCLALDTTKLSMEVDFDSLPDISSEVQMMEDVMNQSLADRAKEGKKEFDDIPNRVTRETQSTITNIKNLLKTFTDTIQGTIDSLDALKTASTEVGKYRKDMDDMLKTVEPFDKYRWYGGLGLACISFLIVSLQFFGLFLGCLGHNKEALPTQRGCLSHSGGNMLMAAVGFVFIFSWLLMLLTAISFLIGGNLEKLMCQPLTDPQFTVIKKILDEPGGMWDNYFLGKALLQNGSIPLTFSGLLLACKKNTAAFSAMKLDNLIDLGVVTKYKDTIDIDKELDALNVDLSTVSILTDDTEKQLKDFSSSVKLDYNGFKTELAKDTTAVDLKSFATGIRTAANDGLNSDPAKAKLLEAANDLDVMADPGGSYTAVAPAQQQLLTDVEALETSTKSVPAEVDNTINKATTVENYLQNNGSELIKQEAKKYANRILGIADSFAANVIDAVEHDIGKCKPVWNLWHSIIQVSFCSYIIDSFNGFWFSLGWCIFFMVPSIIFDVKLAKHFRKMQYVEGFDDVHVTPPPPYKEEIRGMTPPMFSPNKVGHRDDNKW